MGERDLVEVGDLERELNRDLREFNFDADLTPGSDGKHARKLWNLLMDAYNLHQKGRDKKASRRLKKAWKLSDEDKLGPSEYRRFCQMYLPLKDMVDYSS